MEPTKIHAIDKLAKATRIISELQKKCARGRVAVFLEGGQIREIEVTEKF